MPAPAPLAAAKRAPAAAAPRGNWLDQLREQKLARRAGGAGKGGAAGDSPGKKAKGLPVLYVFHEGYTNAVKRPVKIEDLLS